MGLCGPRVAGLVPPKKSQSLTGPKAPFLMDKNQLITPGPLKINILEPEHEQCSVHPGWLFVVEDFILPTKIWVVIRHYKDRCKPISRMECHKS